MDQLQYDADIHQQPANSLENSLHDSLKSVIKLYRNLATEVNLAAADTREDRAVRCLANEISESLASSWQRALQTIVSTHL